MKPKPSPEVPTIAAKGDAVQSMLARLLLHGVSPLPPAGLLREVCFSIPPHPLHGYYPKHRLLTSSPSVDNGRVSRARLVSSRSSSCCCCCCCCCPLCFCRRCGKYHRCRAAEIVWRRRLGQEKLLGPLPRCQFIAPRDTCVSH